MPLTEWLGKSPWSDRMIGILDDMWKNAPVNTKYGKIVSVNPEVNGEMLQTLSRVYWMTNDRKYLDWAIRLGDYYLLGSHHPTRDFKKLRLRDHGCEIVSGLTELYATTNFARPEKKKEYQAPIHEMLDRILEVGRNEDGLFYNNIDPQKGVPVGSGIADTWGYTYNGYYTVYLIDSTQKYRQAVLKALHSLSGNYVHYDWENWSSDGDADAIESAINLYNREPLDDVAHWIDNEIQFMWSKQDSCYRKNGEQWRGNGIIEGWHGDGNFARTTIMYCLWKTQGMSLQPWREDVQYGAEHENDQLKIVLSAKQAWNGKLYFDTPRHKTVLHLPMDWPRINQFPEWFTVTDAHNYQMFDLNQNKEFHYSGKELSQGIEVKLKPGEEKRLVLKF